MPDQPLLLIDAGNTNVVIGLAPLGAGPIARTWRLSSQRERTADEWQALLTSLLPAREEIADVAIASVVPVITRQLTDYARRELDCDPLILSDALKLNVRVATDAPHETGADRIANAVAAFDAYGGPTIVVDLGTATKVEAVTAAGDFLGGAIAPGLGLALDSLAGRAARLYAVELALPPAAIGRNTIAAMQSGIVGGHLALIRGLVAQISAELGGARQIVLTGGHAHVFAGIADPFTAVDPHLTLAGLRLAHRLNRG